MLGDQNVNPMYCRCLPMAVDKLYLALASVEITSATSCIRLSLKVAAMPMACGKTVANPALATPCKDSFHQLYGGIPSLATPGLAFPVSDIFSSSVNRE